MGRSENVLSLNRYRGGAVGLVRGQANRDTRQLLHRIPLGSKNVMVVGRCGLKTKERLASASSLEGGGLRSSTVLIDGPTDAGTPVEPLERDVHLADAELPVALVSALHHARGRDDVLIADLKALGPHFFPRGQCIGVAVLGRGPLEPRVQGLAARLGVHRLRPHHRLIDPGEPSAKALTDACVAATLEPVQRDSRIRSRDVSATVSTRDLGESVEGERRTTHPNLVSKADACIARFGAVRHTYRASHGGQPPSQPIAQRDLQSSGCASGGASATPPSVAGRRVVDCVGRTGSGVAGGTR